MTLQLARSIRVALAVIEEDGQILICKRPIKTHMGGFWEFPGGKKKTNETWKRCLRREIKEELGIELRQIKLLTSFNYHYPDRSVAFRVYRCRVTVGAMQPIVSNRVKWVNPNLLNRYCFPPANRELIRQLADALFQDQ